MTYNVFSGTLNLTQLNTNRYPAYGSQLTMSYMLSAKSLQDRPVCWDIWTDGVVALPYQQSVIITSPTYFANMTWTMKWMVLYEIGRCL